ncbi:MAG: hypothetical protein CL792_03615 [Chloroflexi bacterium]|nr:hypothetical protein [Chloroflexota bacterium]|tara:strand:+ start:94 stop:1476 length:1383 start_codon:yes stop_codon:yes gene_type:complete
MNFLRLFTIIFVTAILCSFVSIQLFSNSNADYSEIEKSMIDIAVRQDSIEQQLANSDKIQKQAITLLEGITQSSVDYQENVAVLKSEIEKMQNSVSKVKQNDLNTKETINDLKNELGNIAVLEAAMDKTQGSVSKVEQNYLNTKETINDLKNELGSIESLNTDLSFVVDNVIASVVVINVSQGSLGISNGSGFVVDSYGHIITNYHVIEGSTAIRVRFLNGDTVSAELIGSDPSNDLAVLRVSSDLVKLTPVEFADSSKVKVGENVFAIGNPFSEDFSVSAGIVSAIDRNTTSSFTNRQILSVIQTDAPINPGNSGGPLFNLAGKVIGVNTSIAGPIRGNVGLGFAVPSDTVKRFLPKMKIGQKIKHPQLGISGRQLTPILSEENPDPVRGVLVLESVGAALQAGIITGDIIQRFNNVEIKNFTDLAAAIDKYDVGDKVDVSVMRGTEKIVIIVTLIEWQ